MFESLKTAWAVKVKESQDQLTGSVPEFFQHLRWMRSWFSPRTNRALEAAKESDWGQMYGWFVERNQVRIGELEYVQWDIDSQFWHEYRPRNLANEMLPTDPDEWAKGDLILRNRRFTDVVISVFLVSYLTFPTDGTIRLRCAYVPEERFEEEERKNSSSSKSQ